MVLLEAHDVVGTGRQLAETWFQLSMNTCTSTVLMREGKGANKTGRDYI